MAFKKGEKSPNPRGRPKGSADRRTVLFQELVPHGGKLISTAVAMALDGDTAMIKLCVDKLVGNAKPVDRPLILKELQGSLPARGDKLIDAIAKGDVTPDQASVVMGVLAHQAKLVEIDELTRRIEALESGAKV